MFTNLAVEFFPFPNVPNFTHHEYAQAACDYGYTGLAVMLALLLLFISLGFRSVLRLAAEHPQVNPWGRRPSARCALPPPTPTESLSGTIRRLRAPPPCAAAFPAPRPSPGSRLHEPAGAWFWEQEPSTGGAVRGMPAWPSRPGKHPGRRFRIFSRRHAHAGTGGRRQPRPGPCAAQYPACRRGAPRLPVPDGSANWSGRWNGRNCSVRAIMPLVAARGCFHAPGTLQGSGKAVASLCVFSRFDDRMYAWTTTYANVLYAWCISTAPIPRTRPCPWRLQ